MRYMITRIKMMIMEKLLELNRRKQVKQMLACFDKTMIERG